MEQNEQFDRIYESTRDDLLRFLMLRTNAAPEAEDLFQEVYRRFYLRLQKNAFPIRNPKWYLFSVARKVLAGFYREKAERSEREQPMPEDTDLTADDTPIDEQLLRDEQKTQVWRLLQKEPELNRRAFLLYYGYDRSQKQIAKALGISEEAVRQRLYRTRGRIRALLESENDKRERRTE